MADYIHTTRRNVLKAAPAVVLTAGLAAPAGSKIARLFADWHTLRTRPVGGDADLNALCARMNEYEEAIASLPALTAEDVARKILVWLDPDESDEFSEHFAMTRRVCAELRQLAGVPV